MPLANRGYARLAYNNVLGGGLMHAKTSMTVLALALIAAAPAAAQLNTHDNDPRISELERRLSAARAELEETYQRIQAMELSLAELRKKDLEEESPTDRDSPGREFTVGGATRVNYAIGSYGATTGGPSRASGDYGNFSLDTLRLDVNYSNGPLDARFQYRFFNAYHALHTAYLGREFSDKGQLKAGMTRVPFGPHDFGVSKSWFFDQHFYVGLADDMDLGISYSRPIGQSKLDIAYFVSDEGSWAGRSGDSARYAYDVVNESGTGYEERDQLNVRGIRRIKYGSAQLDVGLSLQYGTLRSRGPQPDGDGIVASAHVVANVNALSVAGQLTRYHYDVSARQPLGTDDLVQVGGFDAPATIASAAWIPAVSISYELQTPGLSWLDSVTPYLEYSAVLKDPRGFNDSELFILGAAWSHQGWYIYSDIALSNGNEFIGGETAFGDRLGANADDQWQHRVNLNLGYYF